MDLTQLSPWTILSWLVATAWIAIFFFFLRACSKRAQLRPIAEPPRNEECPRLSVIVAAKNESECIETCIRSLFRQDYPNFEVVAVNDRSTDDTGAILDRLALEFRDRLQVVHVTHLPVGWFGKPHALTRGVDRARGTLICFTDADCDYMSIATLRTAVEEICTRNLDFFTLVAEYSMDSLRECVAVPCCSEAVLAWLRPERMSDPTFDGGFANGAFIMVRRTSFESIGGWGCVRSKICEDYELSRTMKRAGMKVCVAQGEGFYRTASYSTLRDSWNGWTRIVGGTLTSSQLVFTLVRMSIMFVLPLCAMLWGVASAVLNGQFDYLTSVTGMGFAIAFGLRTAMDVGMFRLAGSPIASVALAPLGRFFVMAVVMRALLSQAGLVHTYWRGASFAAGQLIMPRPVKAKTHIQ